VRAILQNIVALESFQISFSLCATSKLSRTDTTVLLHFFAEKVDLDTKLQAVQNTPKDFPASDLLWVKAINQMKAIAPFSVLLQFC
jgi:hypothetical protein